ncbi:MAG: hypothetical protein M3N14_03000 [Bacteroidota bacterium]|nr:hypothetical protein [Bacteroidota bacterium]
MASIIDRNLAKSLIQEYRTQNSSADGPGLKTPEGHHLHGFFINRECLESMLKDPKVTGVSVNFAKHPKFTGSAHKVVTMVIGGAEPAPAGSPTPLLMKGELYSDVPPCPTFCPSIDG